MLYTHRIALFSSRAVLLFVAAFMLAARIAPGAQAQQAPQTQIDSQETAQSQTVPPGVPMPHSAPQAYTNPLQPAEVAAPACLPYAFGSNLFSSSASPSPQRILSPKQQVTPGDRIALSTWGALQIDETASVDSQGFIYMRGVGPVQVSGIPEDQLAAHIQKEVSKNYRDVNVYARLEQNAGVPVMVSGGVNRPGQYHGSAQDNIVTWLQRAGGIIPEQGGYRNISVLRKGETIASADLYAFLQRGQTENIVWQAGDVIVVPAPFGQVRATGDIRRCATFEIPDTRAATLIDLASPLPRATHVLLSGHRNSTPFSKVYALDEFRQEQIQDGDTAHFYATPQNEKVTVYIEGLTGGNRIMVAPRATQLSFLLNHIPVDEKVSDTQAIYIKRKSVAQSEKNALNESLNRLLQSVLTAPASSDGEALIRAQEASLVEGFVSRVREINPDGRIIVMQDGKLHDLPLEDGDTIVIPEKSNIISVEGEVILPRTLVARDNARVFDYVQMSGGYTERALKNDFIIIRPNGDAIRSAAPDILPGDRLLILPRVDSKNMQTAKDIMQILYQIAVSAGVILKL